MATNQGVAQRVIREQDDLIHQEISASHRPQGEFQVGALDGMKRLHDELSAEARLILRGHPSHRREQYDGVDIAELTVLKSAFERLGLDIEGEVE